MLRRIILLAMLTAIFGTLMISGVTAQSGTAQTSAQLNVRSGPGTSFQRIGSLPQNTAVVVEGRNTAGNWALVRSDELSIRGWVSSTYLAVNSGDLMALAVTEETVGSPATNNTVANPAPEPVASFPEGAMCLTTATLNLRSGPGTNYRTLASLPTNSNLLLEGRNAAGNWVLVRTGDGQARGWVSARYVRLGDGITINSVPVAAVDSETFGGGGATTSQPTNNTTSSAVSFAPAGRSIWQATSGADNTTGTCTYPPLVMCSHLAAITLNDNGSISWRGQETKVYTMRRTATNNFAYSGRNGLGNADISLFLTFNSEGSWSMTMRQVFDNDPQCTHTFYYNATRNW